jgi:phytoene/squalene synthetase
MKNILPVSHDSSSLEDKSDVCPGDCQAEDLQLLLMCADGTRRRRRTNRRRLSLNYASIQRVSCKASPPGSRAGARSLGSALQLTMFVRLYGHEFLF